MPWTDCDRWRYLQGCCRWQWTGPCSVTRFIWAPSQCLFYLYMRVVFRLLLLPPSKEGPTMGLFSREGDGPTGIAFSPTTFICGWSTTDGKESCPYLCRFPLPSFFKRQTRKGETGKRGGSSIVERLRGKVSVIRNLGCNYMIARRQTHAGGISLLSKITNEFSLFLMEKSHICKIKSQCLFDERICRLRCPFFQILCAWKEEQGSETSSQGHWSRAGSWLHPLPQISGL